MLIRQKEIKMAKRLLSAIAALSSLTMALLTMAQADAVELGNMTLQSASGQPLLATVQLADVDGLLPSDIRVSVASPEDFERFSAERPGVLDTLEIEVDFSGTSPVLLISSPLTISAPFLSLVLDTRWPAGRLLTEYSLRLESPAFSSQTGAPSSVAPVRSMNVLQEPADVASAPAVTAPEDSGSAVTGTPAPAATQVSSAASIPAAQASGAASIPASTSSPAATPAASTESPPAIVSNASTISVNAGDTLWELALRVRPDASVTVQQTMLALQSLNPDAFIGGNINRVRRGEILQVPELSEIRRLSAAEAVTEVTRQNRLLASGAANLAAQPATSAPSPAPAGAGAQGELRVVTVDEQATDQQPNAEAAGNQSSQNAQQISALEDRVALREEDLARLDSENNELNARLAMLQRQIAAAQELIRLRDLELARMQQTLAEERAAAEAAPAASQETLITMAPDAGPVQRFIQMITSNTWAMLGVVAALILILVLVLVRRNRAAAESGAKIHARNDDGMALGNDADELLFSGVAGSSADKTERVDDASVNKTGSGGDEQAQFAAAMATAASIAYQQVDEQTESQTVVAKTADQEDDWQPADLTEDDTGSDIELDDRFDLGDSGSDTLEVTDVLFEKTADQSAADNQFSVEDTGADIDWPDAESDAAEDVGGRAEATLADFDISASDDNDQDLNNQDLNKQDLDEPEIEPTTSAKSSTHAADDFDDLAFLPSEDDLSDQAGDDDEEDFEFMTDADEAATKLDLARAYIDMGDTDGAREILEEVLKEGTEVQHTEARDLLGRL
jgi:pilus assembly protein FimV